MKTMREPLIRGTFSRLDDTPVHRMLDVLILHRGYELSLKELAENAGISQKTVWKNLPNLEKFNLVKHTRDIGNAKMVTFNQEANPTADCFLKIAFETPFEEMAKKE
ncbi:MAG: winged helix-turn-helix domain-containing protein [Candidatus Bathyarchaeota archaeon]|nr:winged helix-turn-helix domain-containing protein [Candidatus Bathyarchaeota archaeon]